MGCENRVEETTLSPSSSCLSEALLFATMCIIGLPVDVHVKDGSVYSGIFYTASVEKDYGIVLKKAKMIKKGKGDANVANGGIIETLVILSGDLVQVVAKGVLLPANGVTGNASGDNVEADVGTVPSKHLMSEVKKSTKFALDKKKINQIRSSVQNDNGFAHGLTPTKAGKQHGERKLLSNHLGNGMEVEHGKNVEKREEASGASVNGRQVGDDRSQGEHDDYKQKFEFHLKEICNCFVQADEVQGSCSTSDASHTQGKPVLEGHATTTLNLMHDVILSDSTPALAKPDDKCCERPTSTNTSSYAVCSGVSTSNSVVDVTSESCLSSLATSAEMVPQKSIESNRSSKEFKLNPGAKIFSPSFINPISATPSSMPTVANMAYIPSNSPVVAVAAAQQEVGISPFAPRSSVPAKFVSCGNLTAGNGGSGSQVSQPIVGHMGSRTQPIRYSAQYHPVQAGPTYVNPNSQAVMVGRLGQLIYVQPVSHDLVQGAAATSPGFARPLLTPHQVQYPKNQGSAAGQALQLCMPPPFIASGQQPFAVPSHVPLLQPHFPANRPIPVPGSNGPFTKFP